MDFQVLAIKICLPLFVCLIKGWGAEAQIEANFYDLFQALSTLDVISNFVHILCIIGKWLFE